MKGEVGGLFVLLPYDSNVVSALCEEGVNAMFILLCTY